MKQEQELEIIHKGIDFANTLKTESESYKSGAGYGYSCGYAAAQEEYAAQSPQEGGTVEGDNKITGWELIINEKGIEMAVVLPADLLRKILLDSERLNDLLNSALKEKDELENKL